MPIDKKPGGVYEKEERDERQKKNQFEEPNLAEYHRQSSPLKKKKKRRVRGD